MSRFEHECPEWDGMVIDESDAEFAACSCFNHPEAKAASEARTRENVDRWHARPAK